MTNCSEKVLQGILIASSVQECVELIATEFDVDFVTLHLVRNHKASLDNPFVRTTYPANWVAYYLLNNMVVNDPILRHAAKTEEPFSWAELNIPEESIPVIQKAMEFGLGQSGFSVPCTDSNGRKSILSVNSHASPDEWASFLEKKRDDLVSVSRDLHIKAVAEAFAERGDIPQLSPREFECLRWTAQGKTYSEIAIILDLSEHTIRSYLKVARLKLDSVSLAQAVAKASNMGLI